MRFSIRKRRRFPTVTVGIMTVVCLFFYGLWFMELHLKPSLMAIAEARATAIATEAIYQVVEEKVQHDIDPKTLLNVQLDHQGKVVFVQPNTMEFNRLSADVTLQVQEVLKKLSQEQIRIPLGQVMGNQFLASMGPDITVTVIPVGTIKMQVIDKFEQAGINQTKHMVYLLAKTEVQIVVPLVSKSVSVETQVPVSEYVVVGDVPDTFVQMPFSTDKS